MNEPIAIQCIFAKATTLVDKGWRISLDLSENSSDQVVKIASLTDQPLYVVIMNEEQFLRSGSNV